MMVTTNITNKIQVKMYKLSKRAFFSFTALLCKIQTQCLQLIKQLKCKQTREPQKGFFYFHCFRKKIDARISIIIFHIIPNRQFSTSLANWPIYQLKELELKKSKSFFFKKKKNSLRRMHMDNNLPS